MPETQTRVGTSFAVRRVVTGHRGGQPVIASDGVPPVTVTSPQGHGLAELLWLDGPPENANAGGEPAAERRGAFPADGAVAARLIRFPVAEGAWLRVPHDDPEVPGMHRTETLDLMVVLSGRVVLGLDDGEYEVGPGDAVVQRGTRHRWRVVGDEPCVFMSVLIGPGKAGGGSGAVVAEDPSDSAAAGGTDASPGLTIRPLPASSSGAARLLITGTDSEGRSTATEFGAAHPAFPPGEVGLFDLWQTGGRLTDPAQGGTHRGDGGRWSLEPLGGGIAMRRVEFAAGHEPGAAGWHTTATIDVGIVLAGRLELALAADVDSPTIATVLGPGDIVVQRATRHRWRPVGNAPAALASVMVAVPDPAGATLGATAS